MDGLTIVKVGGGVLENPVEMNDFLERFSSIPGRKVLVHGGGREATRLMERLGIRSVMVEGRRVTDAPTLDVVTMVYGGLINRRTVAALQSRGCNAIGLTGADAATIEARKRPAKDIDYGFVGDVTRVNNEMLGQLLELGLTPVIAPLSFDPSGSMLNTNADTIASEVAMAMAKRYTVALKFCFELPGVLTDLNDPGSLIPAMSPDLYSGLKAQGVIRDGMIPKLDNCFRVLGGGVHEVWITNSANVCSRVGTRITIEGDF